MGACFLVPDHSSLALIGDTHALCRRCVISCKPWGGCVRTLAFMSSSDKPRPSSLPATSRMHSSTASTISSYKYVVIGIYFGRTLCQADSFAASLPDHAHTILAAV